MPVSPITVLPRVVDSINDDALHLSGSSQSPRTPEDSSPSHEDLITRISSLESQLRTKNEQLSALLSSSRISPITSPTPAASLKPSKKPRASSKPFNFSTYPTRHIALKLAYLGGPYNGFEHANGTVTPLPTIEEVLWKALRKVRLIDPPLPNDTDEAVLDRSHDVIWDSRDRLQKYARDSDQQGLRLELSWEDCEYSKCGRTDRGVSAFGQVIGVRVRSRIKKEPPAQQDHSESGQTGSADSKRSAVLPDDGNHLNEDVQSEHPLSSQPHPEEGNNREMTGTEEPELPYATLLNSVLPPSIRILAVCLDPPSDFDARFSCLERRYKYFFTNPAFMPPSDSDVTRTSIRQGWLNIPRMRDAAKRLKGLHDFRNLCKIDPSKPNAIYQRRITFAAIEEVPSPLPMLGATTDDGTSGPQTYAFVVHGSAFLWHQVRCMAGILFLVGQGLEDPSVVDNLLDVRGREHLGRPDYIMADDGPLVLWECIFGARRRGIGEHGELLNRDEGGDGKTHEQTGDSLKWQYVGDASKLGCLHLGNTNTKAKTDGKFGLGGLADETWALWRKAKMDEILGSQLLGLVLGQGHESAPNRNATEPVKSNSVKIFDGSDRGRMGGKYVSVMQRPRGENVGMQREKYLAGKGARREQKREAPVNEGEGDTYVT